MKTLYHQKSGKSFIFLILKKRHYISSVILLYISTLQAGKHRLFLNILLFGKLPYPLRQFPNTSPSPVPLREYHRLPVYILLHYLKD